ncbi:histidine phosphatase family protein [Metabacillus arenae]|uniref:Histidine phosphatase family protein n=1 Tax=Metabacillus arenae TaxID=2771434 RepID=A0A926NCP3_9BACI|nr:histidine phosphatase family protein [Metabacillus arenae]MBD1381074.1 histidine phosphatase family protein [Metabacillus arenae]
MTTICLVRHGETDWNKLGKLQGTTDIPLNETGIKQAEDCRDYFSVSDFDFLITSPLKRAKQTAIIINDNLNLELIEMSDFKERSFGDAEGLTVEKRTKIYPDGKFPNQEEIEDFKERVVNGIEKINHLYPTKKILLVAHGAVINMVLATLSNGEIDSSKTKLLNACINNIYFQDQKWSIRDYNQVGHLSQFKDQELTNS